MVRDNDPRSPSGRKRKLVNPCPRCGTPMVGYELGGIAVDQCLSCLCTWLDSGELEFLAELEGVDSARMSQAIQRGLAGKRHDARCPRCRRRLRSVRLGLETSPIEVDRCDRGCGFLLDRGELTSLLQTIDDDGLRPAGVVAGFFRELYRNALGTTATEGPGGSKTSKTSDTNDNETNDNETRDNERRLD